MRPESRIPTERGRRVVIAAIMACVLAASTALAVWLSGARTPASGSFNPNGRGGSGTARGMPTFVPRNFGWFSIKLPQHWAGILIDEQVPALNQPGLIPLGEFSDPSRAAHQLTVYQLMVPGAVEADVALRLTGEALGVPVQRPVWVRTDAMTAVIDESFIPGPRGQEYHQLLTAMTTDGRRHIVLRLLAPAERYAPNRDLLEMIAASVRVEQGR